MTLEAKTLTPELLDLMEHEKVIEQGMQTFLDVGWALLAIRDGKKYRHAGYATFEAYCDKRWEIPRQHAYRLIDAAQVAGVLSPIGDIPEPTSEGQLRPLAPLRDDPDKAREAWAKAVEGARTAGRDAPTGADVAAAVAKVNGDGLPDEPVEVDPTPEPPKERKPPTKPDLGGGISHPARFGDQLLDLFAAVLTSDLGMGITRILDPFAGTGRIHELGDRLGLTTVGVELEPEWAQMDDRTICGSALDLAACGIAPGDFDAIVTSPTYGNRLADSHNPQDDSLRRSYKFDLGRDLGDQNSGAMQWGPTYKAFHEDAWAEAVAALRDGGLFILNIKDHIRDGRRQDVAGWHATCLTHEHGLVVLRVYEVDTGSLRQGDNAEARLPEQVWVFRKEAADE